jgi:hypothetical protein
MGLDITAYQKITAAPDAAVSPDGEPVDWQSHFWAHPSSIASTEENWPGRSEGVAPGIYRFEKEHRFRAGSYGGYNEWRRWLARVAGWQSVNECWEASPEEQAKRPFGEIINFSDCEGVIGPKVAAKLAKDFADNEKRAEEAATRDDEPWFLESYRDWRKAFEMAADDGAVDFH